MNPDKSNSLCLECGLCCNGVIFADVQLEPGDDARLLQSLGLKFSSNNKSQIVKYKFAQPCTAFAGCKCVVYSERPSYCRKFECLLLKSVKAGEVKPADAIRTIRSALQRVKKVKRLLEQLGDADDSIALSKRFRRMQRKLESKPSSKEVAHLFGELTLAFHDLNIMLSEKFYPAP
jgi:Fe-S-cluster containining protein